MRSDAATVEQYLGELPEERRHAISAVRKVILANLPAIYEEMMNWGMITYQVPLSVYPHTYNKRPLMYAALASQKNHMALYLTTLYKDDAAREAFRRRYRATGKRMDMGRTCVRFRTIEDLPLDLVGETISAVSVPQFIRQHTDANLTMPVHKSRT
ncbi:MAG: DUF1801 domain-containing protein [Dehalococcoidia bacterium]|nr:DUF1801 domain-containing protein [Dehalococcoidia bacterium]